MPTRTRKPARKSPRKTSTKSPAKKAAQPRFGAGVWMRLPVLDQRDFDLIGLALTALGLFMASVVYLDWGGGDVGEALVLGFSRAIGLMVYALPVALVAAGALVVMRPFLASGRPFGSGGACLFTALALGLAAGTLGIGPGGARADVWDSAFVEPRGGLFGQALYTLAERAVSDVGAHILAVFLFAAGVLLVTGATIAGVIHSTRRGVLDTGRRLRDSTSELGGALSRRREPADAGPAPAGEPLCPPEPSGELVVRATHVEAPSLDTGEHPVEEWDPDGDPEPAPDQATMASEPPAGTEQAGVMHAGDPPRRPEA